MYSIPRLWQRLVLGFIAALILICLSLRIHGYSLPIWHQFIDGSPAPETLRGSSQPIRSDDYLLDLPLILAQVSHTPPFPKVNQNIGLGQDTFAPMRVPSLSFVALFRLSTWGFFLGPNFGLSWMWWCLEGGILFGFFFVFWIITRGHFIISLSCSFLLAFSPYMQFWSLHKGEIALHWALAFLCVATLLLHPSVTLRRLSVPILGWTLTGFCMGHLYPPIAVTMGWLLLAACCGLAMDRWEEIRFQERKKEILLSLSMAAILFSLSMIFLIVQNYETIQLIRNTVYPGRRFSTGGGYPIWPLFAHNLLAKWTNAGDWAGNICEGALFFHTFPLSISLLFLIRKYFPLFRLSWLWPILFCMTLLGVYSYFGLPSFLAQITLLGMSTSNRTQMAFGIGDLILLAFALSSFVRDKRHLKLPNSSKGLVLGVWIFSLLGFSFWFRTHIAEMSSRWILIGVFGHLLLAGLLLIRGREKIFAGVLAGLSVFYTFDFNPINIGGADYFFENPVAQVILKIERKSLARDPSRRTRWAVFGSNELSNYLKMIGIHSISGYQGHPQFDLWQRFDPTHQFINTYNQSAFTKIEPDAQRKTTFSSEGPGSIILRTSPDHPAFAELGVDYFIAAGKPSLDLFRSTPQFKRVYEWMDRAIYQRSRE